MFKKVDIHSLSFNPFDKIGKDWLLISATKNGKTNTMTASWGGVGVMWGKNVVTTVIRSNRHTYNYIDNGEYFTISFLPEQYKDILSFCGSHSGRDCNKVEETGLKPLAVNKAVTFEQAKLVFVCKKLYAQRLSQDCFVDKEQLKWYSETNPIHTAFVGEIVATYVQND